VVGRRKKRRKSFREENKRKGEEEKMTNKPYIGGKEEGKEVVR